MALRYFFALLVLPTAIACSVSGAGDQPSVAGETVREVNSPSAPAGAALPQGASPETPHQEARTSAEQVVDRLAAEVPTARPSIVYTAETDPNQLLGTPDGYVSKAAFIDTRIDPAQAKDFRTGSVELGGSVEVFTDEADARARKRYLDETIAELPIDVSEYSYVRGPVLLRLSRHFTPEQAAEYEAALGAR